MPADRNRLRQANWITILSAETEQTVENQQRDLEAVAERHGWNVVAVFADAGVSGNKGRERLATGTGILRVAKDLGVGTGTVHLVKRSMAAAAALPQKTPNLNMSPVAKQD